MTKERFLSVLETLFRLYGQVAQAEEGFGLYHDSPTMNEAMRKTEALLVAEGLLKEASKNSPWTQEI